MSMSLDRAGRDAQGLGDLGLAEVKVVAQGQHLALSPGQVAQGGNQPIPRWVLEGAGLGAWLRGRPKGGPRAGLGLQIAVPDGPVTQDRFGHLLVPDQ